MTRTDERWERNTEVCRCCGQPLPYIRLGVRLTPVKARIFDLVQRGGKDGTPITMLCEMIWGSPDRVHALKSHVYQINELLSDHGFRIMHCGAAGGHPSSYRLYSSNKPQLVEVPA